METNNRIETAIQLYVSGLNSVAASEQAHCNNKTWMPILKQRGLMRADRREPDAKAKRAEDAVTFYVAGHTIDQAAAAARSSPAAFVHLLKERGLMRPDFIRAHKAADTARRNHAAVRAQRGATTDAIVQCFNDGHSALAIALRFGITRQAVRRELESVGLTPHTRGDAVRLYFTDMDKRGLITRNAHFAQGRGESDIAAVLTAAGLHVERQKVVGPYNLDIAVDSTAIEFHADSDSPTAAKNREAQRLPALLAQSWNVIYIWASRRTCQLTDRAVEQVIQWHHDNRNHRGSYAIVRGCGEMLFTGTDYATDRRPKRQPRHRCT